MRTIVIRRTTAAVLALGAALALTACASSDAAPAGGRVQVVAATDVWGDVVRQVGGDAVDVTSVIDDPSQDPHSYEADVRTRLAVSRADLVVENGGGYDEFLARMVRADGAGATVVNAVTVAGVHPHDGELNEHVWYDLPAVRRVAARIAAVVRAEAPGEAAAVGRRLAAFDGRLAALERREAAVRATHGGTAVAVTEPVPDYLLQACGLVDRTPDGFSEAIEEGDDVPIRVLEATLDLVRGRHVAVLVENEQTSGVQTARVVDAAHDAGVPVVGVTETLPAGRDYVSWMTDNLDRIEAALAR